MISWRIVLVAAVLTAMVVTPKGPAPRQASMPTIQEKVMAHLTPVKVSQDVKLASRSPIAPIAIVQQKPLAGMKIIVDPGHGGQAKWEKMLYCGGTVGCATGNTESDINLRVALCLRQYLEMAGAKVIMTRISDDRCTMGDKDSELDYRSGLANSTRADLFVSVHHNEGPRDINYTAVFYPSGTAQSVTLAQNISSACSRYMGISNRGALAGRYRVLDRIGMPGVIVEASFMSNPGEDRKLANLSYNKLEAKAIATGILNYARIMKAKQVDFNAIFAPIDDQAKTAQAIADASFIRKQVVESRSLFGQRVEEITYDPLGNIVDRRPIGASSLLAEKARSAKSKVKVVASRTSKLSKSVASKTAKVTKEAVSKASSAAKKSRTVAKADTESSKKKSTSSSSKSSSSKDTSKSSSSKTVSKSSNDDEKSSSKPSKKVADAGKSSKTSKKKPAVN